MLTIKEMREARGRLSRLVDGSSAAIVNGDMKIWLEMVDAYLGNAQVALPPIGWITRDAHQMLQSGSIISTRTDVFASSDERHTVPLYVHPPKQGECAIGVGDGSGNLFVYGSHDAIKRVQQLILDGERWRQLGSEPKPVTRPTQAQVDAAYAVFLEVNGGDTDKAKTDLGTWAIGQHAALAVPA